MSRGLLATIGEDRLAQAIEGGTCLAMTSYFASRPDPQAASKTPNARCRPDDLTYVSTWLATATFSGMQPVIFVDSPNADFHALLAARGCIVVHCALGLMSVNDERFFLFKEFLRLHDLPGDCVVLLTDGSDVIFKRNPEGFIRRKSRLCLGADMPATPRVEDNRWMMEKIAKLTAMRPDILAEDDASAFRKARLVNAGVLGGTVDLVQDYLGALLGVLGKCPAEGNWNMLAFNLARLQMAAHCFIGEPFVSGFKSFNYEFPGYIVHK